MWNREWRDRVWADLDQQWDLIVIGGGITGAGVLRHAVAAGLKTLLVEAGDFSSGTSSRSSKLIHGGLRYILNRQFGVTKESARERERLMKDVPYGIVRLPFLFANFDRYGASNRAIGTLIALYDLLAIKWDHHSYPIKKINQEWPHLSTKGLLGGCLYYDAVMDDCRIVLRVIREAVRAGGTALNYARAESLLKANNGRVCGVALRDLASATGRTAEVKAHAVVNAAGPWVDSLRSQVGGQPRLRPLRGSHLVFPSEKLPARTALTLLHPTDKRAMFVIPWEGVTIVGTTDIDHDPALDSRYSEPFAAKDEIDYVMEAVDVLFPGLGLKQSDLISTFSGLRPVVRGEAGSPSGESRAHALWEESGLFTITGGKYTTFRLMSRQTVERVLLSLGRPRRIDLKRVLEPPPATGLPDMEPSRLHYLLGRHGSETADLIGAAGQDELENIEGLPDVWAELRWAARNEGVVHLDDLLLRRVRIGMSLPDGAMGCMDRIRSIVQPELGWDDGRWQRELDLYRDTWKKYYSPTPG